MKHHVSLGATVCRLSNKKMGERADDDFQLQNVLSEEAKYPASV